MDPNSTFRTMGFLSEEIAAGIGRTRAENEAWFKLADDTNAALMRLANAATDEATGLTNWDPKTVAVRVLLRSCGTFQAVVLLAERRMVAESRTLVRSLVEDSFAIGALIKNPAEFLNALKQDSEASRRKQAGFILDESLGGANADHRRLRSAMDAMDKRAKIMSPKKIAELGPLLPQYLNYQRLSDDAAHLSARSLHRHIKVHPDGSGWSYKSGIGDQGENAATLHRAHLAILATGIGTSQIMKDASNNAAFSRLAERFEFMAPVPTL